MSYDPDTGTAQLLQELQLAPENPELLEVQDLNVVTIGTFAGGVDLDTVGEVAGQQAQRDHEHGDSRCLRWVVVVTQFWARVPLQFTFAQEVVVVLENKHDCLRISVR